MQESLSPEHSRELFANPLEQFLNSRGISNECRSHFQSSWRNIANGRLNIIRDPFHKIGAVFVLDVEHLFINLFHGHTATENSGHGQISSVARITGGHHVFGVKHLLGQFGDGQGSKRKCHMLIWTT